MLPCIIKCSDAIINGGNGYCKVYYNLDFDYIHFYDGRNQDIALGYDFDSESIEFYKKYLIAMITKAKMQIAQGVQRAPCDICD